MSGLAIVLDFLRKNPTFYPTQTLHSHGVFSAAAAATSSAAFSVAATTPFASRFLFRMELHAYTMDNLNMNNCIELHIQGIPIAYCDAGFALPEDEISNIHETVRVHNVPFDALNYSTKEYRIELRPLFSAFGFRALALTSLRSFLMFYLPLLEPRSIDEDEDVFQDAPEEPRVDLVVPFKKSVKQIARETSVVTTRRVLERLAVIYVSQRMAWKLLKDIPKSAICKSQKGMPTLVYIWRVSRTTFRGQFLACAASWVVQVGIDTYRCMRDMLRSSSEIDGDDPKEQVAVLGKRVFGTTVKCSASLVFASAGAGLGAALLRPRPSLGQWIGKFTTTLRKIIMLCRRITKSTVIVTVCFEKFLHATL